MGSSIGYTEGATIEIATHRIADILGKEQHIQRISPGCGIMEMQMPYPGYMYKASSVGFNSVTDNVLFPCDGGARIVLMPMTNGTYDITMQVYLFDKNKMPMGTVAASVFKTPYNNGGLTFYTAMQPSGRLPNWAATVEKVPGDLVYYANTKIGSCTVAGTTGGADPAPAGVPGSDITDGTATFRDCGLMFNFKLCDSFVIANSMGASFFGIYLLNATAQPSGFIYGVL